MLLTAEWILPVTTPPIKGGAIVIRDGLIEAIGKEEKIKKQFSGEEVIGFDKAILLPGFVDAHTHLEYSAFRGICDDLPFSLWKIQVTEKSNYLNKKDWEISADIGALEAIQSGITCIGDITMTGASLRAAKRANLRGVIFFEISEMDSSKTVKTMEKAEQGIREWQEEVKGTNLQIGISPYSVYNVAPTLFQAVSKFAQKKDLLLGLHLAGSKDEYDFVKYGAGPLAIEYRKKSGWEDVLWQPMGVSPVKYVENWDVFDSNVLAVHCIQVNEQDIDVLKRYDVRIVHCPKCSAKLGMGIAPLLSFINRGLAVGIGTDSPASNNTMDLFDEMRIGLLLQRGMVGTVEQTSAESFLEMATLGGAKALRLDDKIGSLEKGKEADIISVDISKSHQVPLQSPYSALVYTSNQENILMTMVKGEILYLNQESKKLNDKEILRKSEPIKSKLM
ncbi:MAG: amidohydrolase family protein [Actinomycetia bacterium]|nr:amidohydrolase family protein [Actinomycetes bacterium]